ncbi:carbohydrate sulfotransferase 4-like [Babylonia areolata]|uniref:carbohydrate sulfotransferase 4-like n=1 Tax=Babylonia areolata TaxID=304850 RepID=UPI003FD5BD81
MKMFKNLSSYRDITVWAKLLRATMCQVALAVLFLCAAATILYTEHLWLQRRRALEEANRPVVTTKPPPEPEPCDCSSSVATAVKEVNQAKQTILKTNIPNTNAYPTEKRQIVVLSYARSGSSFTSDIVIQDPRTFFTFEPLYKVLIRYTDSDQLQSFDVLKSTKFAPKPNEKGELVNPEPYAMPGNPTFPNFGVEATQVARLFLTCQFEHLKIDDLLNFMFLNRNNTIEFYKCIREFPQNPSHFPRYLGCIWKLKEICYTKDVIVSKLIRFPAKLLRPLMEEFPNLKILYLVRDPRGTLSSEMSILKSYQKTSVGDAAKSFCSMVSDDAEQIRHLSQSYPDRIKTIRYETIARDAVSAARRMYRFLELSFTPTIEGYIRHITAAKKDGHNFSTLRKDSWLAANKWRTIVTLDNVKAVDAACEDVYEHVGFLKVNNESHLRDVKSSLATSDSSMDNFMQN